MQYFIVDEYTTEDNKDMSDSESTESLSSVSPHHQASQTIEKDLIMVKTQNLLLSASHSRVMLNINFVFPSFASGSHASPCLCL